ncbi:MAG: hypothetical protein OIN87_13565 [Candidatus Methanoperedens sp.]|nr:hypothetical protein [Candidatus Methanoperedens sp.]
MLREYNELIKKASDIGIKSSDSYYTEGKNKGKISKETGIDPVKVTEKSVVFVKKVDTFTYIDGFDDDKEFINTYTLQNKPSLIERPRFIEKSKASEIPGLLEGFKTHRKR